MRILLTGATGLVGSELGQELAKGGHQVVVLSRNKEHAAQQLPFASEFHEWDFSSPFDASKISAIDVVVHLAGESIANGRWTPKRKKIIYDSRVLSTRYLRKSLAATGENPKVWINASALGFYSDTKDQIVDEETKAGNDFLATVCIDWENEVQQVDPEVRRVILRFGVVLAKQGGFLPSILTPFRLGVGGKIGNGKQWVSWIDLRDLVRVIITAIEDERYSGVFNAVSEPLTNKQMSEEIAKALGKPCLFRVPPMILKLAMGEMAQLATTGQRAVPKKLNALGFRFTFKNFRESVRDLVSTNFQNT